MSSLGGRISSIQSYKTRSFTCRNAGRQGSAPPQIKEGFRVPAAGPYGGGLSPSQLTTLHGREGVFQNMSGSLDFFSMISQFVVLQ